MHDHCVSYQDTYTNYAAFKRKGRDTHVLTKKCDSIAELLQGTKPQLNKKRMWGFYNPLTLRHIMNWETVKKLCGWYF